MPFNCPVYTFRSLWRESEQELSNKINPFESILEFIDYSGDDANLLILSNLIRRNLCLVWTSSCHDHTNKLILNIMSSLDALPESMKSNPIEMELCFKRARSHSP